ncbi:helix-turn-helix domain-containing protein [Sorangium sp. So ce131]|uniref:helix-turn-helix domain-containing protein n=1 Tax=Sorangium sp. So ce131 TaxID=3133282 RepID=UPI003F641781
MTEEILTLPEVAQRLEFTEKTVYTMTRKGEDDDGEETEPPEGPTDVELASAVGVTKALVAKALKKLIADGLVEKLSGRPARYVATGDEA